jgi:fructokinase
MRMGVDVGGTKLEGVVLDDAGKVMARQRVMTPQGDYPRTVETVAGLVDMLESQVNQRCTVGLGTPGALSSVTGLMKNCNSTWLNGKPFQQDLERALQRPVRLANDADCMALSEAFDGAGANAPVVFGAILGTGVGGGVVVNGRLLRGPNAIAGEWGHNSLPAKRDDERPGPQCYCGRHGCIETYLSGPGFALDHAMLSGERISAPEIISRARRGDPHAVQAYGRYVDRLARALGSIINVLDPHVIVLGGGMSNVETLVRDVPMLWGQYVFSDRVDTQLRTAHHGDSTGTRGAAWLWPPN